MKKPFALLALLLCLTIGLRAQWTEVPSGTFLDLNDLWFPSGSQAWIAADSSTLLHSTDAGATWSPVKLSIPFDPPMVAIEFIDADTGYALPDFGNPWVTHDGGATWAESAEFGFDACYGTQMSFGSDAEYFLQRGCFGANGFYTRTDTGMAYTLEGFPPGFDLTDYLHDIEWVDANVAVALGDNNLGFRTTNRGASWNLLFSKDTLLDWKAITFTSPTDGWAVNGDQFDPLYRSTDGGLTWSKAHWLATFAYPEHRSVGASNGHVFAGGDIDWSPGGMISDLRVSDSLFTYEFVSHPVNAFHFPAADIGFAVGDSGMILRMDSILLSSSAVVTQPEAEWTLFPNPSTGQVSLRWEGAILAGSMVVVSDLTGRSLLTHPWKGGEDLVLDLSHLAPGVYLVECGKGEGRKVRKLILE
jgi:photosystem II stability/assembly factor-like uncharacterized protein